jgi:hypothetical protein
MEVPDLKKMVSGWKDDMRAVAIVMNHHSKIHADVGELRRVLRHKCDYNHATKSLGKLWDALPPADP